MGLSDIKKLRELTSLGINACKEALSESKGNFDGALKILKSKGIQMLEKKGSRATGQGVIDSYVHFGGNLAALVEVNCETDFVARTDVFKKFVKDIAMQVAAANPEHVSKEDIPENVLESVKKKDEYIKQYCLLEQAFVKNSKLSVGEYLRDTVSKTGENIMIRRFVRFSLGEADEG
ncbi:MAG: elongation factor Ts [Candidatus Omnitrophica bacterium]|nr:elongation factor Ts [Candidatus Omnitrophota bacterium]